MVAALAVGLAVGNILAPRINGKQATRLVVGIAAAGALLALVQAIRQL
jgi:hypothetical protein